MSLTINYADETQVILDIPEESSEISKYTAASPFRLSALYSLPPVILYFKKNFELINSGKNTLLRGW
jgi:hypothetical protein